MQKRRSWNKITQEEYDKIKKTLGLGLTASQTAEISGREKSTIHRINNTKDFADYQRWNREHYSDRAKLAKRMVRTVGPDPVQETLQLLVNQVKSLEQEIKALADASGRKGWFGR